MKKTRRLAAMFAATALAAAMVVPTLSLTAVAADTTPVSIDTSKDNATHTYSAYQIFAGTYDVNLGLTITGYGTGFDGAGLAADTDFRALVITPADNSDPDNSVPAVTVGDFLGTKTDAASVAQAIEKLDYTNESADADVLATILQKHLGSASAVSLSQNATDLGSGYWIILDSYTANADASDTPQNDHPDAVSKYLLRVSGGDTAITITPKKDYPTVVKKVQENTNVSDYEYTVGTITVTDADYNDVADYNIGDSVPFKLYGTMPSTYDDYDHYYYCFTDTLSDAFTVPAAAAVNYTVTVVNPDGDDEGTDADTTTLTYGTDYTVSISGQKITVEFMDTKNVAAITKDSVITVEYEAVLNSNAVVGLDGQENKVDLEYSNNPNNTGNGTTKPSDTDKTPEDKVIVFTYEQDIKKVDAATGATLENAVFNLYKTVTEDVSGSSTDVNYYVQVDANNKVTGWTTDASSAADLTTGTDGICKVIGLDDGTYYLTEKTPPTSYNEIANPMTLAIAATTANGQSWTGAPGVALTAIALSVSGDPAIEDITGQLTGTASSNQGTVMAQVANEKGVNLPSTGGLGTALFIVCGGVGAAAAGIYLVSKKRAKDETIDE